MSAAAIAHANATPVVVRGSSTASVV